VTADFEQLIEKLAGKFIVLDGPDGCGKSTQGQMLGYRLAQAGGTVVRCKDPGGTEIGDRIRQILLSYDLSTMDVSCETLLFMASRAQLVNEVIKPAVTAGQVVICDRFVSSTCAYQGALGYDTKRILELAPYAIGDCWPDLTILLDVDAELGLSRTGRQPHHAGKNRRKNAGQLGLFDDAQVDAMEARPLDFHRRVREIFLQLGDCYPRPVTVIDGSAGIQDVQARIVEVLADARFC